MDNVHKLPDQFEASVITLTCQSCDLTTTQAAGSRRRTVCPHCGNFYHAPQSSTAMHVEVSGGTRRGHRKNQHQRTTEGTQAHLPQLDVQHERGNSSNSSPGFGKSISNFFKNIGREPKDDGRQSSISLNKSHSNTSHLRQQLTPQLPPISDSSSTMRTLSPRSSSELKSSASADRLSAMLIDQQEVNMAQEDERRQLLSKNIEEIKSDVANSKRSGDWQVIIDYYAAIFDSFSNMNFAFKIDPDKEYKTVEEPGLNFSLVNYVYNVLSALPQDVHKVVLKAIISCLMKDKRIYSKDDLRSYLILLLAVKKLLIIDWKITSEAIWNPQFRSIPTYMIFAHLLRQIANMSDPNHHFLVHWFKRIEPTKFHELISKLQKFVTYRLFPDKPEELPPIGKCMWWIPSATKVLALLNAANNICEPPPVSYQEFYNTALDHLDLLTEYYNWQNPQPTPVAVQFSFCQYPFILSILAKRTILQRDSEQQMVHMARRSLVNTVQQRQMPDIGMLFLTLKVRRSHLVSDSLNEIANRQLDLKKKLKVSFAGEPGLDMGGLTKEWFLLLIRQIFQPDYGMFTYDKTSRVYWFSTTPCDSYQEFNLVGVLMGLAVYNSITLDVRFPPICFRKLLSPAVVPYNLPKATVGIAKVSLRDLASAVPEVAHGLQELLSYEGSVEDDFGLTFQITHTELEYTVTHPLKPNGENIPVTNENRQEYVNMYVDYLLNKAIYRQFQAFYHGFHSVCASNALIMLRAEEVELLVCGNPVFDMKELQRVTVYDGYQADDETVRSFWSVVMEMTIDVQKQVLLFATGSDRVPVGGMSEMQFKITRVDNVNMLPMSHTCFNQLVLPAYRSHKTLKQKLLIALQNAEGFGLE